MVEARTISLQRNQRISLPVQIFSTVFLLLGFLPVSDCYTQNRFFAQNANPKPRPVRWGPPEKRDGGLPLVVSNNCDQTIWPGIGTQAGTGPGTGGFELDSGAIKKMTVSDDWQGRVWGRTNCSFNAAGTGASNLNGNNGAGAACVTGDCAGVMSCILTGATPVTLAEFDLAGGVSGSQVFYDISLVDGYNIPIGIMYIPGDEDIPPNLTNCACVATAGYLGIPVASGTTDNTSSEYPIPYESTQTDATAADWCPWDLQQTQPTKPADGVYAYPDDNIQRPIFDPCLSACSKYNAPEDCCTGSYNSRDACTPPLYATQAKAMCPDAYSYAFDDQNSTFIIPTGGGWEVRFCPEGRSTNILKTFKQQLQDLSGGSKATNQILDDVKNVVIINRGAKGEGGSMAQGERLCSGSLGALIVVIAWAIFC